jgi:hypothetical protein
VIVADEGFAAHLYVANRSTCAKAHEPCDWRKLPRLRKDLWPVLRALYNANRKGEPVREFQCAIDLIFSCDYTSTTGGSAPAFKIFDGRRLIPISTYLSKRPRPDLVEVARRMNWLGE